MLQFQFFHCNIFVASDLLAKAWGILGGYGVISYCVTFVLLAVMLESNLYISVGWDVVKFIHKLQNYF